MPKYKQSNAKINREVLSAIKRLDVVKNAGVKALVSELEKTRQLIVLAVADNGQISSSNVQLLKTSIEQILQTRGEAIKNELSENARKVFVKGIQVVDTLIMTNNIHKGVPYLSETKLKILQDYHAELIKDITEDAKARISREITLSQLGQKSVDDTIKAIGRNLKSPSIFKSVIKRAEVIFKTEVNRVGNLASSERTKQFQTQIPELKKQWIHSHVGIPRAGHLMLDGVIVGANENFRLFGEDGRIYFPQAPHDPMLPASEVINCKCMMVPAIIKPTKS
jgi:hypothetical protein